MKLYKRIALGAVVFGVIGPPMIAACFATLAAVIVAINDYQGLGQVVGGWLGVFCLASLVAFHGGGPPAAIVWALVGAMPTWIRRRYLYLFAIVSAVVVGLLYFAFVVNPGDGPLVFGTGFSIPVAAALTRVFLKILDRHNQNNLQVERGSEDVNE